MLNFKNDHIYDKYIHEWNKKIHATWIKCSNIVHIQCAAKARARSTLYLLAFWKCYEVSKARLSQTRITITNAHIIAAVTKPCFYCRYSSSWAAKWAARITTNCMRQKHNRVLTLFGDLGTHLFDWTTTCPTPEPGCLRLLLSLHQTVCFLLAHIREIYRLTSLSHVFLSLLWMFNQSWLYIWLDRHACGL